MIITGIIYNSNASREYYKMICDQIDLDNLSDYVTLIVGHPSVKDFFKAADIFIHPSDTEGLPRVVMEAMACKVPVVANAVGGVTDYVLDGFTGFLPRHNNVDDYVSCIMRLINNEILRNRLTENAFQLVATCYQKENQLNAMNDIIKE